MAPLAAAPRPAPAVAVRSAPGAASLEFVENKGQWDARARYAAALPSGRLFLENAALTYLFVDPAALPRHRGAPAETAPALPGDQVAGHAYTVHFEGASRQAHPVATGPTGEVRNYLQGSDAKRWARNVGSFRRVQYAGLWPGIDAAIYENAGQQLEYDFALAPGADAARVALRYEGAQAVALDAATGDLAITTAVGRVAELAPQAWQTDAQGRHQPVACRYTLSGSTVRFALGPYDHARALTIDPKVIFSSFTGSTDDNWGFTATYGPAGNLYSGGIAFGPGYPATRGAFQTKFGALCDVALIKYNTQATGPAARVWATYLGGSGTEFPHSLVTNALGEVVILGSTGSTNFPTTAGALSRRFGGGTELEPFQGGSSADILANGADMFVARLSADGGTLLASTYLGGSGNDGVLDPDPGVPATQRLAANYGEAFRSDVLLDGDGNVYVAANTNSPNFPGLGAGFNGTYRGGTSDGVVCKLPPGLGAVTWASLLGGSGADAAYSVQRDDAGRVYVSGGTTSPNFPATAGAYRAARPGGVDGFAARISADGRTLERSTYVGTAGYDQAQFLQLDAAGNAYLLGQTLGGNFPVTAGLYTNANGSQYIQKLDADLKTSLYSTVFGSGTGVNIVPTAFLVDDCERIYVSGWGGSTNSGNLGGSTRGLPVTADAAQRTTDGSDFYLAEFLPGMVGLDYATFFGEAGGRGEHVDGGTSRFDKRGIVYQAVCGGCGGTQGFPVPPGANTYTNRNGSANCNNAAFKMDFQPEVADAGPRRALCASAAPVALGGTPAGGVWSGPGVQRTAGGGYQFVPSAAGPGAFVLTYKVTTSGICQATLRVRYQVAPATVPEFAAVGPRCVSSPAVALVGAPAGGTFSGPGVTGNTFSPQVAGAGTHTLTYTVADSLACGAATQQVVVTSPVQAFASPDTTLCADQLRPFQLRGNPAGGTWSGPGVSASGLFTPPNTQNRGGTFELTYAVTQGVCQTTAVRRVVLAPASLTDVPLNLPVCAAAPQYAGLAPFDCVMMPALAGGTYSWDFGDGSAASTEAAPTHRYERAGTYRIKLTARYAGCEVITQFAPLEVGDVFVPNVITANDDQLNATFQPRFTCQPASLKVFSRWGQEVYATADYHNNWDAAGLPAGLYYYLLRDADDRQVKGWVQVIK
ncbi:PKD domain-containing protein [Hymenobacter nivis]|uniref:PKD domain-containing protein n=1 Tax=Hymenobacter nivis TaxID=1850093 RepID=A0A502GQZ0_9BACT|nr:PKD domain-containing protein [Hymenobacter nivis]